LPNLGAVDTKSLGPVVAISAAPVTEPIDPGPAPLAPTTKVLDARTLAGAVMSKDGVLTLAPGVTTDAAVGDVIVASATASTPHGLLRRVVGVTHDGGRLAPATQRAAIDDAAPQFNFSVGGPLPSPLPNGATQRVAPG